MRSYTCANRMRSEGGRILRHFMLPAITFTMVIAGAHSTYAYTAVKGTVSCTSGKVRKEASTSSSFAFGVRKDEEVVVIDEKKGSDGQLWYQIKVGSSTGYIRSDLVTKSKTKSEQQGTSTDTKQAAQSADAKGTSASDGASGKVVVDVAIMRQGASTGSGLQMCLKQDEEVKLLGQTTGEDGKIWYSVQYVRNGIYHKGYIRSDLIKASGSVAAEAAGKQTAEQTQDKKKDSNSAGAATTAKSTGVQVGTVKGMGVNVREAAVDGSVVGKVSTGRAVTVTEQVAGSDGNVWYKISFISNLTPLTGYIRSDFVEGVTKNVTAEATENGNSVSVSEEEMKEEDKKEENSDDKAPKEGEVREVGKSGAVNGINVNVRKEPVDGQIVTWLSTGSTVTVHNERKAKDDKVWYEISYKVGGSETKGFMRADYIKVEESVTTDVTDALTASVRGYGVRIRESAVNGTVVDQLNSGHRLNIIGETQGSDEFKWYYVDFTVKGVEKKGYIRCDFVKVITTVQNTQPTSDEDFEAAIAPLPDTYKANLRALHERHPNWQFEAVQTGLDWNEAVAAECSVGKNLIPLKSISSWKSTEPQAYSWTDNSWYGFDGGTWASASKELIAYYMDPRNFLDESGIYQFEKLDSLDYQNEDGVRNIISGTFLDTDFTDTDGEYRHYVNAITDAAREVGISPYHLATRIIQEQGLYGLSQSISGRVPGYEGYFNYFNIGAFAANGRTPTINGLIYAKGSDENYYRPWNTRYRSILGSAKYLADRYIGRGQNTLYFEKFNVVNKENGIYSHQYMSNIQAASAESARMKKAYTDDNSTLVFRIPYYYNMPDTPCEKPTSESNPNNYLSGLWIDGYGLTPGFSPVTDTYYLTVDNSVTQINVSATAVAATSSIGGLGTVDLDEGTNTITVVCKAQNGNTRTYYIYVQRN